MATKSASVNKPNNKKPTKESQTRLNESVELAQALMRCAGTGVYIVQDGKFRYVNSLFQELTGYTDKELLGMYSLDLVHPEDRESVRKQAIESLQSQEKPAPYEYRFVRKDGSIIWVLERVASIEYKGKRAATGSFMDITERKRAEEELRSSLEKLEEFKSIIDRSLALVFVWRVKPSEWPVEFVSDNVEQVLGYTADDFMSGRITWTGITYPEDIPRLEAEVACYLKEGVMEWSQEYRLITKSGDVRWFSDRNLALSDSKGEITRIQSIVVDITERKRTEYALEERVEHFRSVAQTATDAIISIDAHGNIVFWNQAAETVFGYSVDEVMGKPLTLIMPERFREAHKKGLNRVVAGGEPKIIGKTIEISAIKRDQSEFPVELSLAKWQAREEVYFTAIIRDITERKEAERKVVESEEKFREFFEYAPVYCYMISPEGKILDINKAATDVLGYKKEEVVGKSLTTTIYAPSSRQKVKDLFTKWKETGKLESEELTIVTKEGVEKVVLLSAHAVRDADGKLLHSISIQKDITERRMAEETLRQSEERYRTILEEMEDNYFEVDLAGNLTFFNDAMCRTLGYSRKELMGMNYRAYIDGEDIERLYEDFNKVYQTGKPVKGLPYKVVRKDGTIGIGEFSVFPLLNEGGEIVGFRGVGRDVTERKQMEQKLADMATRDSLTGLPNRVLLNDRLTVGLTRAQRNGTKLAVMMLDLDRFKKINDTLGHSVGDQLLKGAGERLAGILRKSDTVARMGGDEFVLVLPEIVQHEQATNVAQKILESFRKPFVLDGHRVHVTTSIGIAIYPEDGKNAEDLLKNADTAMYWAKEQGRDNYELYWDDGTKTPMRR